MDVTAEYAIAQKSQREPVVAHLREKLQRMFNRLEFIQPL